MKRNESATPWMNELWYTSPWNFDAENQKLFHFAENIQLHDVTLRDGEQQNGVVFNAKQKVELAEKMAEIGIHRIEAGMAAVTPQDEQAIREICKKNFGPKIFTFARCMIQDLDLVKDMGCEGACLEIPANEELIRKPLITRLKPQTMPTRLTCISACSAWILPVRIGII